jgi:hypothetical protein
MENGMDAAMVNLANNDIQLNKELADHVAALMRDNQGKFCAVIAETRGAEIRTGDHNLPI